MLLTQGYYDSQGRYLWAPAQRPLFFRKSPDKKSPPKAEQRHSILVSAQPQSPSQHTLAQSQQAMRELRFTPPGSPKFEHAPQAADAVQSGAVQHELEADMARANVFRSAMPSQRTIWLSAALQHVLDQARSSMPRV